MPGRSTLPPDSKVETIPREKIEADARARTGSGPNRCDRGGVSRWRPTF
jgi:hypothetical protein